MVVEQFINEKILQVGTYIRAVIDKSIHHTELDNFIKDTMDEWTLFNITEETPNSARERVFWHIIHEISLHGGNALHQDLFFKSEINTCLDFFHGKGSYPIDCIGWRPLA
ncbi:hypothetical protein [Thalassotalea sp. PLHSN55]|uniref:hypothetical protein n=1 Tax=Thalassotalea sp. PLHSN55 TaxID=3435888 RepID=UPI003F82E8C6